MQFGFPRPGRKKRGARSLLAVFCVAFPPGAAPVPGPIVPAQNGPQTTCAPLPLLPRGFHLPRGVSPLGPSSFTLLDESEMGTQAVILQEGKSPSVRDERIERIGRSVARYCDRPQMRFDFRVLPGADEANAFSLVGGHVYVTRDLLEKYTLTDDELAFALGHEIAHAAFRDIPNSIVDQAVARYVDHALCERLGAGSAEYQTASRALQAEIDALIQRRELNADQFGMLYALRAGYHSDGAVTFLEKLREAIGPRVEVPVHPGSFPLHPEIPVRLEEVRKGLSQLAFAANKFDAGYRALHEGDFNLAINTFEELTDVFPQSQNALVNLGAAYHGKYRSAKRAEEPAPIILLAAALEPELKRLLAPRGLREGLDRSWLLIAREKYQTVLDADAENLVARNDLGVALLDDGEIDAAIAQLEIVVAADDADPGSFKNLGIAFCAKLRADRAGSPAATESERAAEESDLRLKAKEAFEKYLKAHPGDVDAKLLLQPLQSGVGQAP